MEFEGNKQYIVYNYNSSPVTVATRYDSYIIPAGTKDEPATFPLTMDEIRFINNTSGVFKYGILWFDDAIASEIYENLRIRNYDKILTDEQIEDCLTDPTADKLNIIVGVTSDVLFNRIRGIYMRIKNTTGLSSKVSEVVERRYREIRDKKFTSSMEVQNAAASQNNEVNALRRQVEELKKMVSGMAVPASMDNTSNADTKAEADVKAVKAEPAPKKAKSTSKAKTAPAAGN